MQGLFISTRMNIYNLSPASDYVIRVDVRLVGRSLVSSGPQLIEYKIHDGRMGRPGIDQKPPITGNIDIYDAGIEW